MGNSWSAIQLFLSSTESAPEVVNMFRAQLEQREVIKLRTKAKKPKEPPTPIQEEKKPAIRRPGRNDRRLVR